MTIQLNKEYQWNQNWAATIAHTDINKVVQELFDIEEVHGKLTPEAIVESSKNKKSVLHSYFEWDDGKAANKWRLRQATSLLTRIEVKTITDGVSRVVRAFEIIKRPDGYNETQAEYSSSISSSRFIIQACIEDLRRVRNKLHGHEINSPLEYIDKAIEELQNEESKEIIPENKLAVVI